MRERDVTRAYLGEIGRTPLLSAEEELELGRRVRNGDLEARNRMVQSNLRLVVRFAHRYQHRGLPLADLIQEGNLGLMRAVDKFDPERGRRLSTYASWWIRQCIDRAIMNHGRTIRIPVHRAKQIKSYLRAAQELAQREFHDPTLEEIARHVEQPAHEVRTTLALKDGSSLVQSLVGKNQDLSLLDLVADESQQEIADLLHDIDLARHIEEWVEELNERQRNVVERRFGLNGYDPATLEEVGQSLGITRERVRQIQVDALGRLREVCDQSGYPVDEAMPREG